MTLYYLEAQMQLRRHMIFIQNLGDDKNIFASHRSFCRITHEIKPWICHWIDGPLFYVLLENMSHMFTIVNEGLHDLLKS